MIHMDKLVKMVPIRPRVGVAIAIADRVLPALDNVPTASALARGAVNLAWDWEEGVDVSAKQLYAFVHPIDLEAQRLPDGREAESLVTSLNMLLYVCWYAYAVDVDKGRESSNDVPSELYDVSDEDLSLIWESAEHTGMVSASWLEKLIACVCEKYQTKDPDALGPAVPRSFFTQN